MIILDDADDVRKTAAGPKPSPSPSEQLPSFEESAHHINLDVLHSNAPAAPYQDPPPNFSPYTASYFAHPDGSIVSHDAHLNEDGEALYRFLLSQSATPPNYHVRIRGTHTETGVRHSHHHDRRRSPSERSVEVVTDFDFHIDLTPNIITDPSHSPVQWSVWDDEPAYRGRMYRQIEILSLPIGPAIKKKPGWSKLRQSERWTQERENAGLPPWTSSLHQGAGQLQSSHTVRQWCDDYCSSQRLLKEFIYTKVVYGWDINSLRSAIKSLIADEVSYTGDVQVEFAPEPNRNNFIIVRPTNRLSRALSNRWIKFLLILTLIYPFIWLYKRFHPKGGGVWQVCGGGYPLKILTYTTQEVLINVGSSTAPQSQTVQIEHLIGEREGVWFKRWETTIRRGVAQRLKDIRPLRNPRDDRLLYASETRTRLDGYQDY